MYCTISRPREREDVTLHYEDLGAGLPLVFLHGFGSGAWAWKRQLARFRKSYRALAPDFRGHGRSSVPAGPYTVSLLVEDVRRFLERVRLRKVVLIGHGLGGEVALRFAADHPARLLGLVLAGARCGPPDREERAAIEEMLRAAGSLGVEGALASCPEALPLPLCRDARERREFTRLFAATSLDGFLACGRALLEGEDRSPELESVTCPALAIVGAGDGGGEARARGLASRMAHCEAVVVEGAAHHVQVEQPDAFNALLADFLRRTLGG